jgi:hypothetical protein
MARIIEVEFIGVPQKVKVAQTKSGFLIEVESMCKALFLAPSRLKCDPWITVDEMITLLLPFSDTHPAVHSFISASFDIGVKTIFPDGLTLTDLSVLLGVSEAELLAELPNVLERIGR